MENFLNSRYNALSKQHMMLASENSVLRTQNAMQLIYLAQLRQEKELLELSQIAQSNELTSAKANATSVTRMAGEISVLKSHISLLKKEIASLCQEFNSSMSTIATGLQSSFQRATSEIDKQELLAREQVQELYQKEKKRRKALHNALMELQGNIRVHCRVRPLLPNELLGGRDAKSSGIIEVMDDENVSLQDRVKSSVRNFEFERVYGPSEGQEAVFSAVQPMLTSLIDGYNVCIMAYGQTGSGKTFTMLGDRFESPDASSPAPAAPSPPTASAQGLVPRAAKELFRLIAENPDTEYTLEISVVEIYNNEVTDLLSNEPSVRHDINTAANKSITLPTVTLREVRHVEEVLRYIEYGMAKRRQTATLIHEHSSRSHLIITLTVSGQVRSGARRSASPEAHGWSLNHNSSSISRIPSPSPSRVHSPAPLLRRSATVSPSSLRTSSPSPSGGHRSATPLDAGYFRTKLQLVDLAGSECIGQSGVQGKHQLESSFINKSLAALSDVLSGLAEHRAHIPYRNSKLTHLLQDSIGGDAKLLVLACVSPAQKHVSSTLSCLQFAERAKTIQRGQPRRKIFFDEPK